MIQSLIQKSIQKNRRYGLILFSLVVMIFVGLNGSPPKVNAEVQPSDPVFTYCQQKVKSPKVRAACRDPEVIQYVRKAAFRTTQCKQADASNKEECVVKQSKAFIDKTLSKKPTSAADFKSKMEKIFKAAGLDYKSDLTKKESADAQNNGEIDCGPNPCATTLDPSYCAALSKEKPNDPLPEGCGTGSDAAASCTKNACDLIEKYANPAIDMLSLAFGIVAVISLILGGINYTTSEGDPQKSSKAKQRIFNTMVAIVAYLFLYSFLQFLIPGGIF